MQKIFNVFTSSINMKRTTPRSMRFPFNWVIILTLLFFGPYFPGTPYRIDQFLGVAYILLLAMHFLVNGRLRFYSRSEKVLTVLAFLVVIYTFLRVLSDFKLPLQIVNYQLHLATGMALWYFHRNLLISGRSLFVISLLTVSIPITLFSAFQYFYVDHPVTLFLLDWYNGPGKESYDTSFLGEVGEGRNTIAAMTVLTGTSMTSIFTGKNSLAMFCLFIIAIAMGARRDTFLIGLPPKAIANIALASAAIGGFFSTSKVFFFGIIIYSTLIFFTSSAWRKAVKLGAAMLMAIALIAAAFTLGDELRVLGDLIRVIQGVDIFRIFLTRFGEYGYLTQYNYVFYEPLTWIAGHGAEAGGFLISDSHYRAVLVFGGLPFFFIFSSFVLYLLVQNWKARRLSPYALPFFALGVTLLFSAIGIPVYWTARIVPLWVVANVLLAVHAVLRSRQYQELVMTSVNPSFYLHGRNKYRQIKPKNQEVFQ